MAFFQSRKMARNVAFRPDAMDTLEGRVVLSTLTPGMRHVPHHQVSHFAGKFDPIDQPDTNAPPRQHGGKFDPIDQPDRIAPPRPFGSHHKK